MHRLSVELQEAAQADTLRGRMTQGEIASARTMTELQAVEYRGHLQQEMNAARMEVGEIEARASARARDFEMRREELQDRGLSAELTHRDELRDLESKMVERMRATVQWSNELETEKREAARRLADCRSEISQHRALSRLELEASRSELATTRSELGQAQEQARVSAANLSEREVGGEVGVQGTLPSRVSPGTGATGQPVLLATTAPPATLPQMPDRTMGAGVDPWATALNRGHQVERKPDPRETRVTWGLPREDQVRRRPDHYTMSEGSATKGTVSPGEPTWSGSPTQPARFRANDVVRHDGLEWIVIEVTSTGTGSSYGVNTTYIYRVCRSEIPPRPGVLPHFRPTDPGYVVKWCNEAELEHYVMEAPGTAGETQTRNSHWAAR